MTEFTSEFIAEQKNIISKASPLPWARCNCGKCADIISIPLDAEVADLRSHQDECEEEGFPYSKKHMEDVDLIVAACNNYQDALDEIERQRKRIAELENEKLGILSLLSEVVSEAYLQDPFGDASGMALLHAARTLLETYNTNNHENINSNKII